MKVTLIDHNAGGVQTMLEALGICRGKKCTMDTLNNVLDAKPVPHLSVLEFGWACVKVEGASVKTRIQLERHRLFSSLERSTRAIDMSEAEVVVPSTAKNERGLLESMIFHVQDYESALEECESLEDASYLLPLGVETEFYFAGNIRTWFEYFGKRLCKKHIQDEHYRLAVEMWTVLLPQFPILKKAWPCKTCGACKEGERG